MTYQNQFCWQPFANAEIHFDGTFMNCCSMWNPVPLGNILKDHPRDLWNGAIAKRIRESIHDSSYRFCTDVCPMLGRSLLSTSDILADKIHPEWKQVVAEKRLEVPAPQFICFSYDTACNLSCPSCRSSYVRESNAQARFIHQRVIEWLFPAPHNHWFNINITGSGDPIGSPMFRDFLENFDFQPYPNVGVWLQTNGLGFTPKQWEKFKHIQGRLKWLKVSFDAGTSATYAKVRRGGVFKVLLENAKFIGQLLKAKLIDHFHIDYVVQWANYREMPLMAELAREVGAERVIFSRILNWGTFSDAEYKQVCIWDEQHPEHADFLRVMRHPALADPVIWLGNCSDFRR